MTSIKITNEFITHLNGIDTIYGFYFATDYRQTTYNSYTPETSEHESISSKYPCEAKFDAVNRLLYLDITYPIATTFGSTHIYYTLAPDLNTEDYLPSFYLLKSEYGHIYTGGNVLIIPLENYTINAKIFLRCFDFSLPSHKHRSLDFNDSNNTTNYGGKLFSPVSFVHTLDGQQINSGITENFPPLTQSTNVFTSDSNIIHAITTIKQPLEDRLLVRDAADYTFLNKYNPMENIHMGTNIITIQGHTIPIIGNYDSIINDPLQYYMIVTTNPQSPSDDDALTGCVSLKEFALFINSGGAVGGGSGIDPSQPIQFTGDVILAPVPANSAVGILLSKFNFGYYDHNNIYRSKLTWKWNSLDDQALIPDNTVVYIDKFLEVLQGGTLSDNVPATITALWKFVDETIFTGTTQIVANNLSFTNTDQTKYVNWDMDGLIATTSVLNVQKIINLSDTGIDKTILESTSYNLTGDWVFKSGVFVDNDNLHLSHLGNNGNTYDTTFAINPENTDLNTNPIIDTHIMSLLSNMTAVPVINSDVIKLSTSLILNNHETGLEKAAIYEGVTQLSAVDDLEVDKKLVMNLNSADPGFDEFLDMHKVYQNTRNIGFRVNITVASSQVIIDGSLPDTLMIEHGIDYTITPHEDLGGGNYGSLQLGVDYTYQYNKTILAPGVEYFTYTIDFNNPFTGFINVR